MRIAKLQPLSLFRALAIYVLGLVSGIQIALYLYDYYDDGIAELESLLIGLAMAVLSICFILYSFRKNAENL